MAKKLIQKSSKATVSNSLNEMFFEQKDMTLQAFRMLMFYLAKINPKRPEFTEIKVPLAEYAEMLGVELNEKAIDKSTDMLLGYVVKIEPKQSADSKYEELSNKVQVFTQSKLLRRKSDGELLLTFKCHDELKPHIFNLQSKFTKFEVWNILNLSAFQDMRMYMLLSQYRVAGERTLELAELKEKLGISKDAYPEYKIFSRDVLKKCQTALKERTDICFEFTSVGRPAHSVYFKIYKNQEYTVLKYLEETAEQQMLPDSSGTSSEASDQPIGEKQITIDDFLDEKEAEVPDHLAVLVEYYSEEFTVEQFDVLYSLAIKHVDHDRAHPMPHNLRVSHYVMDKIKLMKAQSRPVAKEAMFSWVRKAVDEDWQ